MKKEKQYCDDRFVTLRPEIENVYDKACHLGLHLKPLNRVLTFSHIPAALPTTCKNHVFKISREVMHNNWTRN